MMSRSSRWGVAQRVLGLLSSSLLGGCSDADATGPIAGEGPTGTIEAELSQVPAGVSCIKVTSSNGSIQTLFNVTPGQSSVSLTMPALPLGGTEISASAYGLVCGSVTSSTVPGWIGAPVWVDVNAATRPQVKLTLFPNEPGAIDVNFHPRITGMSTGGMTAFAWTDPSINPQTIYAWGYNGSMLLQVGTSGDKYKPTATTLTNLSHVNAGGGHGCGVVHSGLSKGNVMCWGQNNYGQLGDGTTTVRPTAVTSYFGQNATQVSAGGNFTCIRANGLALCTGYNYHGQLGNGTTTNSSTWVGVNGGYTFSEISAGEFHACGRVQEGVRCWGYNYYGQVGNGNTLTPAASPQTLLRAMVDVRAGGYHTCARREDQTVWCWGSNGQGQLGDGTTTDRSSPVQVTGVWGATSLAVGTYHSCARLSSGTVSCWGYNNNGQLGDGTAVSRVYPTQVPNLYGVVDVFAASNQTCARLDTGAIRCWGNNNNGQLGNDTNSYAYAPSQVVF